MTTFTLLRDPVMDEPRCAEIAALYRAVGWGLPGNLAELRTLYQDSSYTLLALEEQRVVGLLRAESEHAQRTWLAEIAVLPGHQRQGVGKALLQRFIADHPRTQLYTDATQGMETFFQRHGIALRRSSIPGPRRIDA